MFVTFIMTLHSRGSTSGHFRVTFGHMHGGHSGHVMLGQMTVTGVTLRQLTLVMLIGSTTLKHSSGMAKGTVTFGHGGHSRVTLGHTQGGHETFVMLII